MDHPNSNVNVSVTTSNTENTNFIFRLIQKHYGNTKNIKSPAQIKSEENLVPGIKFNRWFCMPAAIIEQFCVGSVYAWSVFNKPIDNLIYGQGQGQGQVLSRAPITFTIAIGFLGFSAAVMGPWLERKGPKIACILGSSLFFIGNLLTALALYLQQMWLIWVGYGMIGGFGIGLCYISPVSALQKWFPDHRGLASGIAVCGFGAGSIAMAKVQLPVMQAVGLPLTFIILGSSYYVIMMVAAQVLRTPPPGFEVTTTTKSEDHELEKTDSEIQIPNETSVANLANDLKFKWTLMSALASRDFRLMYIMFLSNIVFGLVLISRLSNMVTDIFDRTPDVAATVVSINSAFNLAGRLVFSISSDYIGRKNCYFIMLTTQLIVLGCFSTITSTRTYWAFLMTMWTLTSCYGAGFSVIPAFLSDKFGPNNIGACHGVILTAWSIAGVGGGLIFTAVYNSLISSGYSINDSYPYNVNAWWIFGIVMIGWTALLFVKPTKKDKMILRKPSELIRRVLGMSCPKIR